MANNDFVTSNVDNMTFLMSMIFQVLNIVILIFILICLYKVIRYILKKL